MKPRSWQRKERETHQQKQERLAQEEIAANKKRISESEPEEKPLKGFASSPPPPPFSAPHEDWVNWVNEGGPPEERSFRKSVAFSKLYGSNSQSGRYADGGRVFGKSIFEGMPKKKTVVYLGSEEELITIKDMRGGEFIKVGRVILNLKDVDIKYMKSVEDSARERTRKAADDLLNITFDDDALQDLADAMKTVSGKVKFEFIDESTRVEPNLQQPSEAQRAAWDRLRGIMGMPVNPPANPFGENPLDKFD